MNSLNYIPVIFMCVAWLVSCDDPPLIERDTKGSDTKIFDLQGIWRSTDSQLAFRILPDQKADFYIGESVSNKNEIFPATITTTDSRVRFEIASPLGATVENFIVSSDHLRHEATDAIYYPEDIFITKLLEWYLVERTAIGCPTPEDYFYIHDSIDNDFDPKNRIYGQSMLKGLEIMQKDGVLIESIQKIAVPGELTKYKCILTHEAQSLPIATSLPRGWLGVKWGIYSVSVINKSGDSIAEPGSAIFTGIYTFTPNSLGERIINIQKIKLASQYKYRIRVKAPKTIAEPTLITGYDWGYIDKESYETEYAK